MSIGNSAKNIAGFNSLYNSKISGQSFIGILDLYPNAAVAYSVRKLKSSYTGFAIRVRRSSDNNEQDIGFTPAGNLDETALTNFTSGTDGYITTWYDQSGNNNNLIKTTAINQPQIVGTGVIFKINTKPYLYFSGQSQMEFTSSLNFTSVNSSLFIVNQRLNSINLNDAILEGAGGYIFLNYAAICAYGTNFFNPNPNNALVYNLFSATNNIGGNLFIYNNNINIGTKNPATGSGVTATTLMTRAYGQNNYLFTELIMYAIDQNSNLNGINTNINTYYGIY